MEPYLIASHWPSVVPLSVTQRDSQTAALFVSGFYPAAYPQTVSDKQFPIYGLCSEQWTAGAVTRLLSLVFQHLLVSSILSVPRGLHSLFIVFFRFCRALFPHVSVSLTPPVLLVLSQFTPD